VAFGSLGLNGTYTGSLAISWPGGTNHNATVTVTDNSVSGSGSTSFSIQSASAAAIASVSSINYATTGGKNNDKHLNITVTVNDDTGNAVSGASVSINLLSNGSVVGSGNGTTGSTGTVTFVDNNAPPGTYMTEITNVVAAGLSWDGQTPSNSFEK